MSTETNSLATLHQTLEEAIRKLAEGNDFEVSCDSAGKFNRHFWVHLRDEFERPSTDYITISCGGDYHDCDNPTACNCSPPGPEDGVLKLRIRHGEVTHTLDLLEHNTPDPREWLGDQLPPILAAMVAKKAAKAAAEAARTTRFRSGLSRLLERLAKKDETR